VLGDFLEGILFRDTQSLVLSLRGDSWMIGEEVGYVLMFNNSVLE
jgi:hypothetical protein